MAVIGNGFLTVIKFIAFVLSGSGAMMSEAVHSFADTANQSLLYIGSRRSEREADDRFHYGYGADRYVFALISAMGIFVLGCGVTVYHGVHSLMHPPELSLSWITFAVLGISFVVDGFVFAAAIKEINQVRGKTGLLAFIKSSTDPTLLAVLFEDFVATTGVVIAAVGIGLAQWTGNPAYDSASSIIIGAMLGILAMWLGWRNRELILGPAISEKKTRAVVDYLEAQDSVTAIKDIRTRIVGANSFKLAADIDYDGAALGVKHVIWLRERIVSVSSDDAWTEVAGEFGERIMESLGDEIDRIEAELGERFPQLRHVDFEAD